MTPQVGRLVSIEMKKRFTGPSEWAKKYGFSRRTVNDVLHRGLGSYSGGPKTKAIIDQLIRDEYIDTDHNLVEKPAQDQKVA